MQLEGKGVLISGGSRGLGLGLARALARRGARLALVARGSEALERAVTELRAQGADVHGLAADVGEARTSYRIAAQAASLVGPIDVLINAASTLGETPLPVLLDTRADDFERVLQVNLLGAFRLIKATAGQMAVRGAGLVVNVSSDAAVEPYPGWGAYGASKAALEQLTRIWAAELEPVGVRVVSVDPGEMNTAMHAAALPDADPSTLADPDRVAEWMASWIEAPERLATGARLAADAA